MAFKILKNKSGQGNAVEYAIVFFMVVAAVAGMSTYVKRGMQARIQGARNYMWVQVKGAYNQYYLNGVPPAEYEPYYVKTLSVKDERTTQNEVVTTWPGHEGVYQTGSTSVVDSTTESQVASPGHAD